MKTNVIYKAILSEKAYAQMEHGIYTFVVDAASHKNDVKKAVESQFATKVSKIRLLGFSSKTKRVTGTRKTTQVGGGKKAIVVLEKGQKIAMLSPKSESKKAEKKKNATTESTEKKPDNTEGKNSVHSVVAKKNTGLLSKLRRSQTKKEEEDLHAG